jgi:hypothetical protein
MLQQNFLSYIPYVTDISLDGFPEHSYAVVAACHADIQDRLFYGRGRSTLCTMIQIELTAHCSPSAFQGEETPVGTSVL